MSKDKKQNKEVAVVKRDSQSADHNWLSSFFHARKIMDGWSNIMTGLGLKNKDARMSAKIDWRRLSEMEIENLYAGDAIASKVVELPIEEATKKEYTLVGISDEEVKKLKQKATETCLDEKNKEAQIKSRLYGGSVILKVYDDDLRLDTPAPKDKPIKGLVVLQRFDLMCEYEDLQKDLLHPDFGKPMFYTYIAYGTNELANVKIHASRLVRFDGSWLPDNLKKRNQYWHDTVLSKPYDAIRNYADGHDAISASIKDLSVAVFKMKDLADNVAANGDEGDSAVIKRLEQVNMSKAIARLVVVDAEGEEFKYENRTMTGAKDLVDKTEDRLSAETSIPKSVLLGQSPEGGGLSEGGTHSMENWDAFVVSYQKNKMKPQLLTIYREFCVELNINPQKLDIEFAPLDEPTEKEKVETRAKQAETDERYINMGVADPTEIRDSRFGTGKYSVETKIDATKEVGSNVPDDVKNEMNKILKEKQKQENPEV